MTIGFTFVIIDNIAVIIYAALIAIGGWLAYRDPDREREGKGVLIASLVCAGYFVLTFILAWIKPTRTAGLVMDIVGATILGLFFVYRFYQSQKLEVSTAVPLGMILASAVIIGLSTAAVVLNAIFG